MQDMKSIAGTAPVYPSPIGPGGLPTSFCVRLKPPEAKRIVEIASAREWALSKTISKLVVAALDAQVLK